MGWSGHERRRPRRPEGTPTYDVDRDGPEWTPPPPYWARWRRRARELITQTRYEAYPDHEVPFPDLVAALPPLTTPRGENRPRARTVLTVVRGGVVREVQLDGAGLEQINLQSRLGQSMIARAIDQTLEEIDVMEDQEFRRDDGEGQGLAEYALLLALISIVAIVALIVLGSQINAVFDFIGQQIPGNAASPAP
jgi:Flp pilus assembly pilin Flp